ncbi:regulator of G-protein signaling 22 [Grus japonensis]|uniref:Regulator of G-protein signaling 22 n=1 Tax=Grus japonensis TaxID=30415 RepID=A0ABC9WA76_GRUJA
MQEKRYVKGRIIRLDASSSPTVFVGVCIKDLKQRKGISLNPDSPKDQSYKPLTTSTSNIEDSNPNCPKRRLSFSQQRTSTLDESKCKDPLLLEPECLSPIQCKDVIVSNTNEFNESVLMSVSDGLLRTPTYTVLPEANEGKFLTSINSLVENFNFEICDINSPPVKLASYPALSTPEDSGYNSLHLDKSGDSLSDHEGSFQEFFQKRKEGSKILDSKRKTRKLERVRRLSTLREQGSQSETEDHHGSPTSACMLTEERNFVSEDDALVLEEQPSADLVLSHGDLSRTPALKIVHEICLQRQRSDQNQISKNIDGTEIFALEHVLAGLIGKKMGLEKLDILTELKYRNLKHVLAIVLDALTVETLCSIWKVSKNWREIIVQDKSADKRRKLYIKHLKEEAGEECLATDDMLVDYFNEFLSLPTFAQPIKFNSDFGVFEVVNDAPQHLESQLKKILHDQKPPNPIYDVLRKAKNDGQVSKMCSISPAFNIDPNYTTMCLDREQAIQWIKKERLPAFLESDCYFEYRLAKLISQVEWSKTGINFIIDSDYNPWIKKRDPSPPSPEEDDTSLAMKKFCVSLGQAMVSQTKDWFTLAKQSESMKTTDSSMHPVASSEIQDTQCLPGQHERKDSLSKKDNFLEAGSWSKECHQWSFLSPSRTASGKPDIIRERSREAEEGSSVAIAEPHSHTHLRVYLDPKWDSAAKEENGRESATSQTLKEFQPAADTESDVDFHKQPEVFIHELENNEFACGTAEPLFSQSSSPFTVLDSKGDVRERYTEEVSLRSSSESDGADSRAAWCISHRTYDTGNRHEFERFKKFIKGTLGERYWWLWMDIERLKALKDTTRQQRGPRFCVTHSTAIETASAKLKLWHMCQERPRVDIDPFPQMVSLLQLTPKSCIPRIPPSLPQRSLRLSPNLSSSQSPRRDDISSSRKWPKSMSRNMFHCLALDDTEDSKYQGHRKYTYAELLLGKSTAGSVVLGGSRMESMLQSLYLENRAGYYFTHFCEKSGSKLWKNSVYFWFDLQAYHQLFYQETLHPFKICKQAQAKS